MAHQTGRIYEAGKKFYVQYRTTKEGKRVQVSHNLCDKDNSLHRSKSDRAVKLLRDTFMLKVNTTQHTQAGLQPDMRVADYWKNRYLPYCEEVSKVNGRARMKPSTIRGYKYIWEHHLSGHFGAMTLLDYTSLLGKRFLNSLVSTQGLYSLRHTKALASAIFSRAVDDEILAVNPWREVRIPKDAVEPERTGHYTLEEAEDIITALVDRVDGQLIMALACFLGLRPGEIAALKWEDADKDYIHIRRNVVRGIVGTPKTRESVRDIPLIDRVRVPLELWRRKAGDSEWIFDSGRGTPVDLHNLTLRVIKPAVKAAGLTWKGLYAGRRGAVTLVIEATGGNYAVAQALAGHKSMKTTLDVYKKAITPDAFAAGMKQLEEATERK
jgi:integrase